MSRQRSVVYDITVPVRVTVDDFKTLDEVLERAAHSLWVDVVGAGPGGSYSYKRLPGKWRAKERKP